MMIQYILHIMNFSTRVEKNQKNYARLFRQQTINNIYQDEEHWASFLSVFTMNIFRLLALFFYIMLTFNTCVPSC